MISLGYGLLTNDLSKYTTKIGLLSFMQFVANAIYWAVIYANHSQPLSKVILLIVSLPCSTANALYSYWILFALRRTVNILKQKRQELKLTIIRKFAYSISILILIAFMFFIFDAIVKLGLDRNVYWKLEWMFQSVWFLLYAIFLAWTIVLIRPNDMSKVLAEID